MVSSPDTRENPNDLRVLPSCFGYRIIFPQPDHTFRHDLAAMLGVFLVHSMSNDNAEPMTEQESLQNSPSLLCRNHQARLFRLCLSML
jgi:hypothetical protein